MRRYVGIMTRRLFLHIGMMKSGTTYLQSVCDRNVEALRREGLAWVGGSAEQQAAAVMEFRGGDRLMSGDEGAWRRARQELIEHDGDALISYELLAGLPVSQIRPFAEALPAQELIVVITVRDLSRVIPSRWQETTQNRGTTSWATYLGAVCDGSGDDPVHRKFWLQTDAGRVLRDWSGVVPAERMRLITVPPPGAEPDELWRRFAAVVGADPGIGRRTRAFDNTSLGAVSSQLMLRMNGRVEDLQWPSYRMGFKAGMAKRGLAKRTTAEPRVGLPPERRRWVEQRTDQMVGEIKAIGPQVVGDLAELVPAPGAATAPTVDWSPSDAELLAAAMDGMESLGRQLARANLALRKVEAEARQPPDPGQGSLADRVRAEARRRLSVLRHPRRASRAS